MTKISYEKQFDTFRALAKKYLQTKIDFIVEIGARDCAETLAFAASFPHARILTFECNPDTLPLCRERTTSFPQITLIEKAVSNTEGSLTFYPTISAESNTENPNPGASSLFKLDGIHQMELSQREVVVTATTLAHELKIHAFEHVDLLWMDIQGAELLALKGAKDRLSQIKMIHTEVEFHSLYQNQPLFSDLQTYLESNGFSLLGFTYISPLFGDAVFIHKSVKRFILPEQLRVRLIVFFSRVRAKSRSLKTRMRNFLGT